VAPEREHVPKGPPTGGERQLEHLEAPGRAL
jgi:hypothetical protein